MIFPAALFLAVTLVADPLGPGDHTPQAHRGRSTLDISANDLIWEFFEKNPMKKSATSPAVSRSGSP